MGSLVNRQAKQHGMLGGGMDLLQRHGVKGYRAGRMDLDAARCVGDGRLIAMM